MKASSSLHKRKALFCIVLYLSFSSFTADILDLREELRFLPSLYSSLDSNITTGVADDPNVITEAIPVLCAIDRKSSVKISFFHLFPHGLRAPPSRS